MLAFKYIKGLFVISVLWLLPAIGVFIFDSCKKAKHDTSRSGEAARKFNEVLEKTRATLGSITLENTSDYKNRLDVVEDTYYLDFPAETDPEVISDFSSNVTIQTLTNVLTSHGVSIDDSANINADLAIQVPEEQIINTLQPLVVEAKNYLMAKGVTSQEITEMLIEENAEEIDLIPFVKTLTAIEEGQYVVRNIKFPFITQANAMPHFVECGIAAIGGDAAYSLAYSGASSWTWSVMKSVFKSVAKRFLGPIGVAFAVISFATCMLTT